MSELPELKCDVCKKNVALGVASSGLGAVSWAFCLDCLDHRAEPSCMFEYVFDECGEEVADFVKALSTFINGEYVSWPQYAAMRGAA